MRYISPAKPIIFSSCTILFFYLKLQEDKAELEAYLAKMKKRGKPRFEEKVIEEKTSLHSKFHSPTFLMKATIEK